MFVALFACSKSNPLVGKWGLDIDQLGTDVDVEYVFNSDGTMQFSCDMEAESPKMSIDMEGTYSAKIDGKSLSGKYTYDEGAKTLKITIDPATIELKELDVESLGEGLKDMVVESIKKQYVSEETYTDVEVVDNTLNMNFKGRKVSLKSK